MMKVRYNLKLRSVPLSKIEDWDFDGSTIRRKDGKYFSVMGVSVTASNREVECWDQPMIDSISGGVLCSVCQKRNNNILHFLVQARVEPGNLDILRFIINRSPIRNSRSSKIRKAGASYDIDSPVPGIMEKVSLN